MTGLKGPQLPETAVGKMFMRVCGCSACLWALRLLGTQVAGWSELSHIAAPCRLPISDATYYANAHVLLHDDTCFRFAYKRNDTATIQMMDPDKTEVSPGAPALLVCLLSTWVLLTRILSQLPLPSAKLFHSSKLVMNIQ